MDVIKRLSKAALVWTLWWPFMFWQAAVMSVKVFKAVYQANSINPRDWDIKTGLTHAERRK